MLSLASWLQHACAMCRAKHAKHYKMLHIQVQEISESRKHLVVLYTVDSALGPGVLQLSNSAAAVDLLNQNTPLGA